MTTNKVILVVDDDQQLAKGIQDYLQAQGYVVYLASDGMQAQPLASARRAALVILDVNMPMTNGLKALEQLRSSVTTKDIPVIMMTGVTSSEVFPTVQNMPMVSHVKKPCSPEDLLSLVRHYIR